MSFKLTTEQKQIRQAVAEVCADFPGEYWRELDSREGYPEEFVKALTEGGWLAALIPEEYGGGGLSLLEASLILEQVNRSGGNSAACHAQMYIMGTLVRHGSDEQKRRYLPALARGELRLQAFGVTEPTTGSDTTSLKTTAVRRCDKYVINGQKVFISRVEHSDLMLLLARTTPADQVEKRTHGISTFLIDLIEAQKNGCEIKPIDAMVNHNTCEVFFDNVPIPGDALIGEEGRGFLYILDGMNAERCLTASEAIGNGRYFVEKAVQYANDRIVFDRPIG